ncbi:MAG: TatD family hydrolase [Candidatus Moraniibacteriota bacterium]
MIDIHTHLFWTSYDADRDEVVSRAREAGVTRMVCVGTEPEDDLLALAVAEKYEGVFAAVGIHPHFFNELIEKQFSNKLQLFGEEIRKLIEALKKLAQHEKVIAIGECGLDYFSHDPAKVMTDEQKVAQKAGFMAQIALAKELSLPLIIHTRPSAGSMDAYEDLLEILKANESASWRIKAILHCYMGDTETTRKFLALSHVYFSFAGNITYPVKKTLVGTKDDLTETVKLVPIERLFVETDCPFLAPQGKRGERNEPAFVVAVAEEIALLRGLTPEAIERSTEMNGRQVFNI